MKKRLPATLHFLCLVLGVQPAFAAEDMFFEDIPVVLSVSRIAQRLDETPAAVTVLDRTMIRQTGARDVADLLRFVPGFQVSNSFESNAPQGSYQLSLKDFANRMQVLIDGRSVYSPMLWGSTGAGLEAVAIDDIERIEVTRGTNAAAYGARAFLGMINIVTRDVADTLGTSVHLGSGENGVQDVLARIGWGDENAHFRLTADQRADNGLRGSGGSVYVNRINFSGAAQLSSDNRLELRAGQSTISAGIGVKEWDDAGIRDRWITTSFAQVDWMRILSADQDLGLQYSHTEESIQDLFPNTTYAGVVMDLGGGSITDNITLQHNYRFSSALRWTWGGELRRESVRSQSLFNTTAAFNTDFRRLFGNAEWHIVPSVILNAGSMLEYNSDSGATQSPRAMLNWKFLPGQTLRYGVSQANRPPSVFENYSNQVYQAPSLVGSYPPNGVFVNYRSIGGLVPETIFTRELGYFGTFEPLRMQIDIRAFEETVTNIIKERKTANGYTKYYINTPGVNVNGVEGPLTLHGADVEAQFTPWDGGRIRIGYEWIDNGQLDPRREFSSGSLMFSQKFAQGLEFSLMYSQMDQLQEFPYNAVPSPATSRTDLRIAKSLQWRRSKGELSLVVQNLGPKYQDYTDTQYFEQRTFVMLKVDH